jgi:hypothetical protein
MPTQLETDVRRAAEKLAKMLADASDVTIQTNYIEIDANATVDMTDEATIKQSKPAAFTQIMLDGDNLTIIPMRRTTEGGLVIDETLLDLHTQNVDAAIEYRARAIEALAGAVKSLR